MWLVGAVSRRWEVWMTIWEVWMAIWQVGSMDDNLGEWVESMGVASGRG